MVAGGYALSWMNTRRAQSDIKLFMYLVFHVIDNDGEVLGTI